MEGNRDIGREDSKRLEEAQSLANIRVGELDGEEKKTIP